MTETELRQLLKEILKEDENEFVELKLSQKEDFGQYVSALSNGACLMNKDFGYLIFGINNKTKKIEGTKISEGDLKRAALVKLIEPKIDYFLHSFYQENKKIILVKISAARGQPTYFKGQAYARIGEDKTSLKNLTNEQIKKIYNSTTDWSAQIVENATFEDLDIRAVKKACKKIKEKKRHLLNQNNPEILLDKARITIDGKITNTALILLGKPESIHFLSPAQAEIIHKLVDWKLAPNEITSKYFHPPFLLTLNDVWKGIRNNKIKIFASTNLFPDIADKYDEEPILEALNNCLAHQDYTENKRIILYEKPDLLTFESAGSFFEGRVEDYIDGTKTPKRYRNKFLADAMRELDMIDIEGSGINKIYLSQRKKFFPSPDYKTDNNEVSVTIYGKIIDEKFSQILMEKDDLNLSSVVLLDHVQKGLKITKDGADLLKKQKLIEGRKPKYFIAARIAEATDQKEKYIKNRAFDKYHYKALILQFLGKFKEASRKEINNLLFDKLSDILSIEQKKKKIDNLLYEMASKDKSIKNSGSDRSPQWRKLGEN